MKSIGDAAKFIIADHNSIGSADHCPNPLGWYHSVAGIENTPEGLVATYRLSDSHTGVYTHIMTARSSDGGKSWSAHRSISHRNVWEHRSVWVAPQLSRLRNGRLVVICDQGRRSSGQDWPMLTRWQERPARGMDNYLLFSSDNGRTWSEPVHIDSVGGEPGYITELRNGNLIYTRTEPARYPGMFQPPAPWGDVYYRNVAVGSTDGGNTSSPLGVVTDAPYFGDSEVGTVEIEPGHLLALTRIGHGGGKFGQPSRIVHSYDGGRTWQTPTLSPVYGQRTVVRMLQSGNLLVTYRNRWGTPATCAFVWSPAETLAFQTTSFLWERDRCSLRDGIMHVHTASGRQSEVEFSLFPALSADTRVLLEIELRRGAGSGVIVLSAGFGLRIDAGRVSLARSATASHESGCVADATVWEGPGVTTATVETGVWHTYRLERSPADCRVYIDGAPTLHTDDPGLLQQVVRFGSGGQLESQWRRACARVEDSAGYSIDWEWDSARGYPDQFQRDRVVVLDYGSDSGYSDWTQLDDGTIVVADYNSCSFHTINSGGPQPVLRCYRITEEDLW